MAMRDADPFAGKFDDSAPAQTDGAKVFCGSSKFRRGIVVAEHEPTGESGACGEERRLDEIAAMDDRFGAVIAQHLNGGSRSHEFVMRVGDDSKDHYKAAA